MTLADAGGGEIELVSRLLGGTKLIGKTVRTRHDAHEMLLGGLPGQALTYLLGNLKVLGTGAALESAIGISLRTLQRRKVAPATHLSREQSGRIWKFAEILARASAIFGSQARAEDWLMRPAMGLNRRVPVELLATPAGTELVEDFLTQMQYGVYV